LNVVSLVDFGSTFTKVTLVAQATGRLVARAESPTTIRSDVMEGYRHALELACDRGTARIRVRHTLAASSAGGGLRMAAAGLVADLTAAAAEQAALNAGAKVELVLSGDLDRTSRDELERLRPEILLFSGGIDGGQRARVLANAELLAAADAVENVVVACNGEIARPVADLFRRGGRRVRVVENVMPAISTLNIEPARQAVHDTFIEHVIHGKGLSRSEGFDSAVVMPTPEAVLAATRILATQAGTPEAAGIVVVDVGGATTDVHSALPRRELPPEEQPLLPLPPVMRTVQGDLGVRFSSPATLGVDREWLEQGLSQDGVDTERLDERCALRHDDPSYVPTTHEEALLDERLAVSCLTHALRRHCGRLAVRSGGRSVSQRVIDGPDLREVRLVLGTGGVLNQREAGIGLLATAVGRRDERSLTPRSPELALDRSYVLAAAGLLGTKDPRGALSLMLSEIPEVRHAA
jgi:uncharacterized protein (TIGR01319 family)